MTPYTLDFEVRDYECDLQGIVNNAVYQNYLEHTRHRFLKSRGLDFAALSAQGINLVMVRIELDYLFPLRSGDHFRVSVATERVSRLRIGFRQEIYRLSETQPEKVPEKAIVRAFAIGTATNAQGRPIVFPEVEVLL